MSRPILQSGPKLRGHRDFRRWNSKHPADRVLIDHGERLWMVGWWVSLTKWLLFNVTAPPLPPFLSVTKFLGPFVSSIGIARVSGSSVSVHSGGFCEVRVDLCHRHCISINFHRVHVRTYVRIPIWPVILLQLDVKRASPLEEKSQLTFTHSVADN